MKTTAIIAACEKAWNTLDLSVCKPLGLDASTWIAGLTASVGILLFFGRRISRWWRINPKISHYVARGLWRSRFENLCRSIKPIMDENYRLFSRFGPNSGLGDGLPKVVRHELGIWLQIRKKIAKNNAEIRSFITINLDSIPNEYEPLFKQWLNHIDAFSAHLLDVSADYRDHQFPREVSAIVKRFA